MIKKLASVSDAKGTTDEMAAELEEHQIWAMFLDQTGRRLWSTGIPDGLSSEYTVQDVAAFSRGYLQGYPVFVWGADDGLLVLGYPKDSYTKFTSNYLSVRQMAQIVQKQSVKIKDLVLDLNLTSKLEYEMQPLRKEAVRPAKLLRAYTADALNTGIPDNCPLEILIDKNTEAVQLECDPRLIARAVNNLVQNSIGHNPQGCHILISLASTDDAVVISVKDDGAGFSEDKLREFHQKTHCMESDENRHDLRYGLGLLLVYRIVQAHGGTMAVESSSNAGCETILPFPR